jgi:hypothetical protein
MHDSRDGGVRVKHDCMEAGGRATHGAVAEDARTEFPVITNSLNKIDFQWSFNDVVLSAIGTTKQSNTNTTSLK